MAAGRLLKRSFSATCQSIGRERIYAGGGITTCDISLEMGEELYGINLNPALRRNDLPV